MRNALALIGLLVVVFWLVGALVLAFILIREKRRAAQKALDPEAIVRRHAQAGAPYEPLETNPLHLVKVGE